MQLSNRQLDALAASAARDNLLAYAIGQQIQYRTPPHIELLAAKLMAVERGEIKRLAVFMPPRHGKSNLVSEIFPAWYMGRNPNHQVMFTTYGQDLADGFGRKVRNAVADPKHTASFPGSKLSEDSQSAKRFNTEAGGVYYAVGAGGAVTGRGADCIVEGTLVNTAAGLIAIENLQIGTSSGKILSLNVKESSLEYRELQAVASREADGIYRITTTSGRVLEVTGNHRIFVGGQYRPASSISPGEAVVAFGEGWEAEFDAVALVERLRTKARVYDIQVEENANFFAGGVLVHNCLIIDDPLKSREEADSKLIRDKLWDWYASTAYTRLMPGGAVVLVQTRWHMDDLAGRILLGHENWEVINLPAIAEGADALGRKPGQALWPDQYDVAALANIKATIGEREFTALYQQRPSPIEGALFRRDWIGRQVVPRSGTRIAMGVDLALSTKTSADYTACVVMARDEFGKLYVLDAVRERVDFPNALRLIKNMAEKWKPNSIAIEQVAYQAVVVQELLRQTTLPIRGVTPDKDKLTRAQPLALRYEQGLVHHAQLPSWFEDELLAFPQSQHDDAVDALVYAYQSVMSMAVTGMTTDNYVPFEAFDSEMGS